ncbi:hypothetical protein HZS_81 [Henneguya salminicola]|nr:hypothetical protein HZS_81 [Henneguya salminicola]
MNDLHNDIIYQDWGSVLVVEIDESLCLFYSLKNNTGRNIGYIEQGSTIISDKVRAYFLIGIKGYTHLKINHIINFVDTDNNDIQTKNIESFWRWAKLRLVST